MNQFRRLLSNPVKQAIQLLAIFILISLIGCQPPQEEPKPIGAVPTWRRFTTANSPLPNQQINALAINRGDIVWVGTANGLARYQQSQWTLFTTANSALTSNVVQALTLEPDGTLWVGTNKGLARYDGANWTAYTTTNSSLPDRAVMSLTYDPINKLTWVGTAKGIVSINSAQQWTVYDELGSELVFAMTADQTGALWLGTHEPFSFRGRIKRFDKGQWTTYQLDQMGFESTFPYAIGVDKNNVVVALLAGTVVSTALRFTAESWSELSKPAGAVGLRALALRGEEVWVGGRTLSQFDSPGAAPIAIPQNEHGVLSMAVDSRGTCGWAAPAEASGCITLNPKGSSRS